MDSTGFSHVGWVPCVSGRLFFRHADCGMGTAPFTRINYIDDSAGADRYAGGSDHHLLRHLVVSSVVDWRDQAVDERGRRTTGRYRVTLLSQGTPGAAELTGTVYLIPEAAVKHLYADVATHLAAVHRQVNAGARVGEAMAQLRASLDALSLVELDTLDAGREPTIQKAVEFRLDRTGIVLLRWRSGGAEADEVTRITVLRSAFYYIRNTWHVHKHHHPNDECLTTIHPLDEGLTAACGRILDDLKEAIVAKNRNARVEDASGVNRARGLATYTRSLVASLHALGLLGRRQARLECDYLDNVMQSLRVTSDNVDRLVRERRQRGDYFRNVVLFLLAVLTPSTLMYREAILERMQDRDLSGNVVVGLYARFFGSDYSVFIGFGVLAAVWFIWHSLLVSRGRRRLIARRLLYRWWVDTLAGRWALGLLVGALLCLAGAATVFFGLVRIAG